MTQKLSLPKRLSCEALGCAFLLASIVGSGIMAERLCGGNAGLALLANSLATGFALFTLISIFAPLSGAHFNPWVTGFLFFRKALPFREAAGYVSAQLLGSLLGVGMANLMFDNPFFFPSHAYRSGGGLWLSEWVATFGLLSVVIFSAKDSANVTACRVGAYIVAAYWFTASTSFANPAVTLARAFTDTFSGIRIADVPAFLIAQASGVLCAAFLLNWLTPQNSEKIS